MVFFFSFLFNLWFRANVKIQIHNTPENILIKNDKSQNIYGIMKIIYVKTSGNMRIFWLNFFS